MDAHRILGSLIYDLQTKITTTDLQPLPLSLNDLITISPQIGIVPGIAMDEIDYAVDYDPALYDVFSENASQGVIVYNSTGNSTGIWGPSQHRNTSVDVYEWTRSSLNPFDYTNAVSSDSTGTYTGTVYNASEPTWVEAEEYVVKHVKVPPSVPAGFGGSMLLLWEGDNITNATVENQAMIEAVSGGFQLIGVSSEDSSSLSYSATGGGGGSGEEYGNGGGGGGGGSGGYYQGVVVPCSPGDVFSFAIGHGRNSRRCN
ncbi:unnamed protein product [Sphagnum tenellum]